MTSLSKPDMLAIVGMLPENKKLPPGKHGTNVWGIPAQHCHVGSKLRHVKGSACEHCYAMVRAYTWPMVKGAYQRRLDRYTDPRWVVVMTALVASRPLMRWFDSGDLQSLEMLRKIVQVVDATTATKHWLPTREKSILWEFSRERSFESIRNLVVRFSAPMRDGVPVQRIPAGVLTSTIHEHNEPIGFPCSAEHQGGHCGDCRRCWSKRTPNVSYSFLA